MIEKICIVLIAGAVISFISGMSILYDKYRWFRAHPSDLRFDAEQSLPQQITKKEQMENVQKLTRDQAREIMLRHYAKSIGPEWNWYAEITTVRFYVCFFACIPLGAIFCLAIMSGAKSPDETKMEEYRKKSGEEMRFWDILTKPYIAFIFWSRQSGSCLVRKQFIGRM